MKVGRLREMIAATFIPAMIVVCVLTASVAEVTPKAQTGPTKQLSVANAKQVIDLRPVLKSQRLREGSNVIHVDSSGLKVSAIVQAREIVGWVATDKGGRQVPGRMERKKDKCLYCVLHPEGDMYCYEIECPKKPPKPKLE